MTREYLLDQLRDTERMYADAIAAQNFVIAANAAGYIAALCRKLQSATMPPQIPTLASLNDGLDKLGDALARYRAHAQN